MKTKILLTLAFVWFNCALVSSDETAPSPAKAPLPDAAALKEATKLVNGVFKDEIAKAKKPEEKAELANKLLEAGIATTNDIVGRYAVLCMAQELAASSGNVEVLLSIIDEQANLYELDILKTKADALAKIVRAISKNDCPKLVEVANDLIDEAISADRYDVAKQLAAASAAAGRISQDLDLVKAANRTIEINEVETAYGQAKKALAILAENPSDPAANLMAGRFNCFVKGNWEKGLPMLAQVADAKLKAVVDQELAKPGDAEKQVELADGWWDLAEKETPTGKKRIRVHALQWYQTALPGLSGLTKAKVEKRMTEATDAGIVAKGNAKVVDLLAVRDALQQSNVTRLAEGLQIGTLSTRDSVPVPFKAEFVVRIANVPKNDTRICYGRGMIIFNWECRPDELRFHDFASGRINPIGSKGLIPPDKWVTVLLVVTEKEAEVFVDGVSRAKLTGDYSALKAPLGFECYSGQFALVKGFKVLQGEKAGMAKPVTEKEAAPDIRAILKAIQGTWTINYTNGATRRYSVSGSSVSFGQARGQTLFVNKTSFVVQFNDNKLEVVTLTNEKKMTVLHFNPASDYPNGKPATTGTATKMQD